MPVSKIFVVQISVNQMSVCKMSVGQISVNQMSVSKMSAGQMSVSQIPISPMVFIKKMCNKPDIMLAKRLPTK
jgi:hypothetical protein